MSAKAIISRFFSFLFVIVFMLAIAPPQDAHAAGMRYAKTAASGTGDCSSWANACTLHTALTGATSGDEIWVAAGTYKPGTGSDRTATFQLKNGVAIYGGFAGFETMRDQRNPTSNLTILSGDIDNNDSQIPIITDISTVTGNDTNSYHVVTGATGAILDGFTITAGYASGSVVIGSGMYNDFSSPLLENVSFSGNFASGNGGGMYNHYSNPTLTNITFSSNSAGNEGGGIQNFFSSPILTDITFSGNSANYGGGMYNIWYSSPSLMDVTFSGNSASYYGGGMFNGGFSNPVLTRITFINNSAVASGGGIFNRDSSSPTLADVIFSGNSSSEGGGIRNHDGCSPILMNVTFDGNSANTGGGMFTHGGNPSLLNVTINNNSATNNGGGMFNNYSSPSMTNVTFSGNSAVNYGGGMNNTNSSSPTLSDVTFSSNSASEGGGLYNVFSSNPVLTNVTFDNNSASSNGGGIYGYRSNPTLVNVTFSRNSATNFGGGICLYVFSNPTLTNVTLNNNSATLGGGIYNYYSSSPIIDNTILWGNTATTGAQMYNIDTSTSSINDSVIQGDCPIGSTCTNIISTDPLMGTLGDYGGFTQTIPLQIGSSAIDAGNDITCASSDQRGIPRPQGAHCDIGSFEFLIPMVSSIMLADSNPTNAANVNFSVTFSESVTGVDISDFILNVSSLTGALVTGVSGSGATYTVTVGTGTGNGTIRLDVTDDDSIIDVAGTPLGGTGATNGNFTGGETYTIDKTTPAITINAPAATFYLHPNFLTLDFSAVDVGPAGLKEVWADLDGMPVASGQVIDLYTLSLGDHTLTVYAMDKAYNQTSKSVVFSVTATIKSTIAGVNRFYAEGKINNAGIRSSLLAKLNTAQTSLNRGNIKAAKNALQAFINAVQVHGGKLITADAATLLITDAQWVIAHPK
jgi:predicted outer membrane repeat protein